MRNIVSAPPTRGSADFMRRARADGNQDRIHISVKQDRRSPGIVRLEGHARVSEQSLVISEEAQLKQRLRDQVKGSGPLKEKTPRRIPRPVNPGSGPANGNIRVFGTPSLDLNGAPFEARSIQSALTPCRSW